MSMLKNMLVTGAAGFIGCHFVREQLKQYPDRKIIGLDKLTYAGNLANLADVITHPHFSFIKGDICDEASVNALLRQYQIDTIIHFAAESHVDKSIKSPGAFVQSNIVGTYTLLQCATDYWLKEKEFNAQVCHFHHISTDEVYGSLTLTDKAFTETSPYQPSSPYSASKASSDHLVRAYFHTFGLPVTLSHCSNNYGPYQHTEKLIPTIIRCCLEEKPIPLYGNGKNIRDWLFVVDHVTAIDQILRNRQLGESYNVGGINELSNLEITYEICSFLDKHSPRSNKRSYQELIQFVNDRPGHDFRYAINASKLTKLTGWQPQYSFTQALKETILHYMVSYEKELSRP